MKSYTGRGLLLGAVVVAASSAFAIPYGGIEFPDGAISFADKVISYDPHFGGGAVPTDANYTDPTKALGIPDYNGTTGSVSLGAGGRIVLQFTDNRLTGSNSVAPDLHIFEVGPDVEDTFVDVSKDGVTWFSVGKVFGATSSIDLDAFGFGTADQFAFVRLTDDINEGARTGSTVGADIDAVGAISTVPADPSGVPDGGSTLLLAIGGLLSIKALGRLLRR